MDINHTAIWYFDQDYSRMLKTVSSTSGCSTVWTVSYPISDTQLLLTVPSASSTSACASCLMTYVAMMMLLLLLLAGDIETNPGPTGKCVLITVLSRICTCPSKL